jgi:YD repeat-containing protein
VRNKCDAANSRPLCRVSNNLAAIATLAAVLSLLPAYGWAYGVVPSIVTSGCGWISNTTQTYCGQSKEDACRTYWGPNYYGYGYPAWGYICYAAHPNGVYANMMASTGTTSVTSCPTNATLGNGTCTCNQGYMPDASGAQCQSVPTFDRTSKPIPAVANSCFGNPIYPLTGTKKESIRTDFRVGWLDLRIEYETAPQMPTSGGSPQALQAGAFGKLWDSNLHLSLSVSPDRKLARINIGNRKTVSFFGDGSGAFTPDADSTERLISIQGGYRYIDAIEATVATFDLNGSLASLHRSDGGSINFIYSDSTTPPSVAPASGYLIGAQDNFGRTVAFTYAQVAGSSSPLVSQITGPAGQVITASYTGTNLAQLQWQDGRQHKFLYEDSGLAWALTGKEDENSTRYASFTYDGQGRTISTESAGGANRYSVAFTQPPSVAIDDVVNGSGDIVFRVRRWLAPVAPAITTPHGGTIELAVSDLIGMPHVTSRSQPAGSGCGASTSHVAYDLNGNVAQHDDFNGSRACYAYDTTRNVETTRVEGLSNSLACSGATGPGATLPAGSRKISSQWHPDWRLATKVAEPGRITTNVYNGQPDPFEGNALASCAPAAALLPDGKPIVVLCKKVEQATVDVDGSQGFAATLQAGVQARIWRWTYNQYGQVLTELDPLNNSSSIAYYGSTTEDYTPGDRQSVTNAKGHATLYQKYNKHGQVLRMIDPNGMVVDFTYDLRQRLTSESVGGQVISYAYDPAGQLTRVTMPDASWVGFEYDDAHRQVAIADSRGNRIEYTLDNAGNRVAEHVKDPDGVLVRQLARSIDALGRVQRTTSGN